MILFHGSPATFTKFAPSGIGDGAGRLTYGYGHYLSQDPGIARQYRLSTSKAQHANPSKGNIYTVHFPDHHTPSIMQWDVQIKDQPAIAKMLGFERPRSCIVVPLDDGWGIANPVTCQIVSRNWANEDAARRFAANAMTDSRLNLRGSDIWKSFAKLYGAQQAAEQLSTLGILGMSYQECRTDKHENFVVFPGNEDLLTITHINDAAVEPQAQDGALTDEQIYAPA